MLRLNKIVLLEYWQLKFRIQKELYLKYIDIGILLKDINGNMNNIFNVIKNKFKWRRFSYGK